MGYIEAITGDLLSNPMMIYLPMFRCTQYDIKTKTRKLNNILPVCWECYFVKHLYYTQEKDRRLIEQGREPRFYKKAKRRICRYNKWHSNIFKLHLNEVKKDNLIQNNTDWKDGVNLFDTMNIKFRE